jgi:hypothetical protein
MQLTQQIPLIQIQPTTILIVHNIHTQLIIMPIIINPITQTRLMLPIQHIQIQLIIIPIVHNIHTQLIIMHIIINPITQT